MFRGRFNHTMDTKGRVSIPARYRMELQKRSDQPPILTADEGCLRLYPYPDWCEHEERIVKQAEIDPGARDYVRFVISGADEAPIDKQGRILVSPELRARAHIKREVTLAGVGPTVELWDTARWNEKLETTQANLRNLAEHVAGNLRSTKES